MFCFFKDTATTEIYPVYIVGSVRCVEETLFVTQPLVLGIVLGSLLLLLATTILSTHIVGSRWTQSIEYLSAGAKQLSEGDFEWR